MAGMESVSCCPHPREVHFERGPYAYSMSPTTTVSVSGIRVCIDCHEAYYDRLRRYRWWNPLTWRHLAALDPALPYRHAFTAGRRLGHRT